MKTKQLINFVSVFFILSLGACSMNKLDEEGIYSEEGVGKVSSSLTQFIPSGYEEIRAEDILSKKVSVGAINAKTVLTLDSELDSKEEQLSLRDLVVNEGIPLMIRGSNENFRSMAFLTGFYPTSSDVVALMFNQKHRGITFRVYESSMEVKASVINGRTYPTEQSMALTEEQKRAIEEEYIKRNPDAISNREHLDSGWKEYEQKARQMVAEAGSKTLTEAITEQKTLTIDFNFDQSENINAIKQTFAKSLNDDRVLPEDYDIEESSFFRPLFVAFAAMYDLTVDKFTFLNDANKLADYSQYRILTIEFQSRNNMRTDRKLDDKYSWNGNYWFVGYTYRFTFAEGAVKNIPKYIISYEAFPNIGIDVIAKDEAARGYFCKMEDRALDLLAKVGFNLRYDFDGLMENYGPVSSTSNSNGTSGFSNGVSFGIKLKPLKPSELVELTFQLNSAQSYSYSVPDFYHTIKRWDFSGVDETVGCILQAQETTFEAGNVIYGPFEKGKGFMKGVIGMLQEGIASVAEFPIVMRQTNDFSRHMVVSSPIDYLGYDSYVDPRYLYHWGAMQEEIKIQRYTYIKSEHAMMFLCWAGILSYNSWEYVNYEQCNSFRYFRPYWAVREDSNQQSARR